MKRVRDALADIQADKSRAVEVLQAGFRDAPEVFVPGIAFFVAEALHGVVVDPEGISDDYVGLG